MVSSARRRKRGIEKAVGGQRKGEADDARSPRAVLSLPWSNVGIYEAQGPRGLETSEDGCCKIEGSRIWMTRATPKGEMTIKEIGQNNESASIPCLKDTRKQRK